MANQEAPNTLLSNGTLNILDLICEGPIRGFAPKNGSFGSDPLVSTYYDDVPVRNIDGSYNLNITGAGYAFDYTFGHASQTGIPGFQKVEAILPLSSNTRIANPPEGAGPFKPVIVAFNSNMFPDSDMIRVTTRIPALMAQDDQNNTNPYEIQYAIDISINNGAFVTVGTEVIRGKCTSTYQFSNTYKLPKTTPPSTFYDWKVRVRRVSQNILSIRTQNEIFVDSISVISTSEYAYPNSVLVGTSINAEQFSSIPSRAYEIEGLLVSVPSGYTPTTYGFSSEPFERICDFDSGNGNVGMTTQLESELLGIVAGMLITGSGLAPQTTILEVSQKPAWSFAIEPKPLATGYGIPVTFYPVETVPTVTAASYPAVWDGTLVTGVWTDNPAWIYYDILTNPKHGLGDYIQAGYVDKWSLYKISQYCDALVDDGAGGLEPRFTCNVVIKQPQDAYTVLLNLASTFRGMLYYTNGGIHASQNQDEPPVYAFNNANVVDGVFSYSDTARDARATVAKVKWVDPYNGYRENVEYIEDVDGIARYGYQEKEMTAFACMSKGQAYRLGSWTLQTERLLTETVTFQTSLEGVAVRPGDNFAVYDNFRNNRAQAGRITSFSPGRSLVYLDRSVAIEPDQVYSLSCIVPKYQLDGSGDITGSSQIPFIRQSQVESYSVTTAATSGTDFLVIAGSFSTGLYPGSPFILAASGTGASVLNQATFYTCLATAEVEAGKIEVLGLKANTGIQFAIQTGYTVVDWPSNPGDIYTPIAPPEDFFALSVTGADQTNTFYSAIQLNWLATPSDNFSHYVVSGRQWNTDYVRYEPVTNTGFNFTRGSSGYYRFAIAAVSLGGVESDYITGGFLIPFQNPLGTLRPLSGVRISSDFDPLYTEATTGYTGYVGINPTFFWQSNVAENDFPVVDYQFISGYRIAAKSFDGATTYYTTEIGGRENTTFQFTGNLLRDFAGNPRGFNFQVETIDLYGSLAEGANIKVDNPPMKAPANSGFVGYNGGVIYSVTPSEQSDTSGIYLWVDQSPSFSPTYSNFDYVSTNLAGSANIAPQTGTFYTWFSLVDTFGTINNPIYGPISGNADGLFPTTFRDISNEIAAADAAISGANLAVSGAYNLITGEITQYIIQTSGVANLSLTSVNALSGQIMGNAGAVNTALNVRVDSIVVSSSGSLSQQINAVRALTELTGQLLTSQVFTVSTALTNSGVALGSRVDVVQANVNTLSGYTNAQVSTVSTALTSSGVALGTRVDTVQANVNSLSGQTNARIDTVTTSLATTSGALASQVTELGAYTTGQNASIKIAAEAFVTGSVNGLGGAARATWGFQLNAGGKVTSMIATSTNTYGQPSSFGTIAFGNANLQSNDYTAGVTGWQIRADGSTELNNIQARGTLQSYSFTPGSAGWRVQSNGDAEFSSIVARGTFSGGANLQSSSYTAGTTGWQIRYNGSSEFNDIQARGTLQSYSFTAGSNGWRIQSNGDAEFNNAFVRGTFSGGSAGLDTVIDTNGIRVGNLNGQRIQVGSVSNRGVIYSYSPDNNIAATLGYTDAGGGLYPGVLNLFGDGGTNRILLVGDGASSLVRGNNTFNVPSDYAFRVGHMENSTSKYGLAVATNWQAIENRIFVAGSVDAGTNAFYERFAIFGEGTVTTSGTVNAASFNTTSSIRYKENVQDFDNALDVVDSLRGVTFDWKADHVTTGHDFGLIAEEVAQVLPTAVSRDPGGLIRGVDYGRLSAVLIEAVKDLRQEVRELRDEVRELKKSK